MSEKTKIARSAFVMSLATFISRILGFIRDMVIAFYFGASGVTDAFFAAFKIPNLFRELFAEGAMSSSFVPVLTEYNEQQGKEEANRLVKIVFTFILIFVGSFCLIGILAASGLVSLIVPGFLVDPPKFELTVLMTRIMFPFLFLVSLAALAMGSLNTRRIFFIPALSSAWFNISVIVSILLLYSRLTTPITSVAIGVTAGGAVQFLFQIPSFYRKGFRFGIDTGFRHDGLKQIGKLIVPASLSMGVAQLNALVNYIFASFLAVGSISYLYLSFRLIYFPVGIFAVAMSMAALPSLSRHAIQGDITSLRDDFSFSLRMLFFISIPSMAGLIALREPIVNLLFQRGDFDFFATQQTAYSLLFYSLGIWSISGSKVVVSAFYSLKDTKTPFKILIIALITNITCSYILMHPLKHGGIALANTISSALNFIILLYFLRRKIGRVDARRTIASFFKALIASVIMGMAGYKMLQQEMWTESGNVLKKSGYLMSTIILCVLIFVVISYISKSSELEYLMDMIKKKGKSSSH
ncbi:MAG: murein biosynthesis integral membrane protein MurJ [Thermodesulfovibrionales bacterium]